MQYSCPDDVPRDHNLIAIAEIRNIGEGGGRAHLDAEAPQPEEHRVPHNPRQYRTRSHPITRGSREYHDRNNEPEGWPPNVDPRCDPRGER
jgi:hypothetical protein